MSDPRTGEPAEQPTPADEATHVDDVVGRANEGLAEAEAASRDAVAPEELAAAHHDLSYIEAAGPEPEPVTEPEPAPVATAASADETASDRTAVITPSEPIVAPAAETAVAAPVEPAPQPIFVQAPEAPRPRGNRGAAGAIGLLAALVFALLYLAASLGLGAAAGDVTTGTLVERLTDAVTSW